MKLVKRQGCSSGSPRASAGSCTFIGSVAGTAIRALGAPGLVPNLGQRTWLKERPSGCPAVKLVELLNGSAGMDDNRPCSTGSGRVFKGFVPNLSGRFKAMLSEPLPRGEVAGFGA